MVELQRRVMPRYRPLMLRLSDSRRCRLFFALRSALKFLHVALVVGVVMTAAAVLAGVVWLAVFGGVVCVGLLRVRPHVLAHLRALRRMRPLASGRRAP